MSNYRRNDKITVALIAASALVAGAEAGHGQKNADIADFEMPLRISIKVPSTATDSPNVTAGGVLGRLTKG